MKNKVGIRRIAAFAVVAIAIVGGAYFLSNWFENTRAQEVVEPPLMDSTVESQKNFVETEVTSDREVKYLTQEVTSAGLTMAMQSIERSGDIAIVEVRWQLQDWRDWKISKASLFVDDQEYNFAGSNLVEGLFQYRDGSACFISMKDETQEKECLPSMIGDTPYRVDHVFFKNIPHDFLQKSIVVKITEVNSIPDESQFCEELDVVTIEELMENEFPGIKLECFEDPGMNWSRIAENTPYTNDEKAIETYNQLVAEAFSGRVAGIWEFDLSD
ncbi:MAG: hypothetical protein AAGU03_00610 [Anaerolineaceae bacterium]